jgi:hypothetical protein
LRRLASHWPITIAVTTAVLAVAAAFVALAGRVAPLGKIETADVMVIYAGADDCAPCRAWRREHWPKFQASPEFTRVTYREVTSPKLFDLLKEDHWPDDLRRYRNTLEAMAGVPLWFIVANDRLVLTARGLQQWNTMAIPRIKSLVGSANGRADRKGAMP